MPSRFLTYDERRDIARLVIPYHGVFYKFWELVTPSFETDEKACPTAQVGFNASSDCISFQINEKFWNTLSDTQKAFIICHECLHILLRHGSRSNFKDARLNRQITNMALDIPINHMLVDYFGFDREEIDKKGEFCWIDTVFEEDEAKSILPHKNFEYYFEKIKNSPNVQTIEIPNHGGMDSIAGRAEEMMGEATAELSDEDKEALHDISTRQDIKNQGNGEEKGESENSGKMAGTEAGMFKKTVQTPPPKPKRKWETIVKKWAAGFIKQTRIKSHWIAKPRRLASFKQGNMFIPSAFEAPRRTPDDKKIQVWLFQDTSASCVDLAPRFFAAFESLPKDIFEVKMHCFDTRVFKLTDKDIKTKTLYGFGGTAFGPIEQFIQQEIKKTNCEYPGAVFVLSDGAGTQVKPQKPQNWYWFLSEDIRYYIPKNSKVFMLKDFE